MNLTPENKKAIDARDYESLLERVRNAPPGDPWFQGETGNYWGHRMRKLRDADPEGAVTASKNIGW